jgi:16S rRNA G1207 methylase RsmC
MAAAPPPLLLLSRVEADRLVIALDQHSEYHELRLARLVADAARRGQLTLAGDGAELVRRCLVLAGTAPALLDRLATAQA